MPYRPDPYAPQGKPGTGHYDWGAPYVYTGPNNLQGVNADTIPLGEDLANRFGPPDSPPLRNTNWRTQEGYNQAVLFYIGTQASGDNAKQTLKDVATIAVVVGAAYLAPALIAGIAEGGGISQPIENTLVSAASDGSSTIDDIISVISKYLGSSNADFGSIVSSATNSLVDTGNTASRVLQSLGDIALAKVTDAALGSNAQLNSVLANIASGIGDNIKKGSDVFDNIGTIAIDAITKTVEGTAGIYSSVFTHIGDSVITNIDAATKRDAETSELIKKGLQTQIDNSKVIASETTEAIQDGISAITTDADSALRTVGGQISDTGHAQVIATQAGADTVSKSVDKGLDNLSKSFGGFGASGSWDNADDLTTRINDSFAQLAASGDCPADFAEFMAAFVQKVTGTLNPIGGVVSAYGLIEVYKGILDPVMEVLGNCLAQTAARIVPTSIPGAGELREMRNRELIDDHTAINSMLSMGFNLDRATQLLALRKQEPSIGVVQTWFIRQFITAEQATEMLSHLGFDSEDINHLLKMTQIIPPTQDLISMAVREAFTPEIAQKFGQYEDFPAAFAQYAKLQGLSTEWAQRYWAAHWSLPGSQQGFEMFQRDVISKDELDVLLRALDIMPYWRDRITAIAYRPLARVDVRRMHALGLFDRAELERRYRHIGYSPEDAKLVAEFTVRLNSAGNTDDPSNLKGLTRQMALKLYSQGIFTEEQTREVLTQAKVSKRAQTILLQDVRVEKELKDREEKAGIIIAQANNGLISYNEAHARLSGLGLTATELDSQMNKLEKAQALNVKHPAKPDLDKLYSAKIIGKVEYLGGLSVLGYPLEWSTRFLELIEKHPVKVGA